MDIRPAGLDDAEPIREIYNREVTESTVTFDLVPRSLQDQREWLAKHGGAHPAYVAVADDVVIGFAALSPYRPKPAYNTTVENSIYVHHEHRGEGVARALMITLIDAATHHGYHLMLAHIVGGHSASIALHESLGFRVVGTQHQVGRKFGQWLDVVIMERAL